MKAVRFDDYGAIEVLEVRDVPRPEPGDGQVLVAVRAAGINPSEAAIRAGVVAVGDEVIGFTNDRASQAEYVLVELPATSLRSVPAHFIACCEAAPVRC